MSPPDLTPILTSLTTQSLPLPSKTWLTPILTARNPAPPLPSLLATVRARLLASDFTSPGLLDASYTTSHSLPAELSSQPPQAHTKSTTLSRDVVFQVLDIENLSKSRWSQVEELEAIARGEGTKGREVIRLPTEGEGNGDGVNAGERGVTQATQPATQAATQARQGGGSGGGGEKDTHKLVLQDCKGLKISALELRKVERVGIGKLNIGEKILVKAGAKVSRGVIMLEPGTCVVLGGKVEAWHKSWTEGRLGRLKEAASGGEGQGGQGGGGGGGQGR
ncbi:RecQ mediated genome instability protein Rmi1 [Coniochaeta sp. 2T2.1]|nr:RecQ mediated genome instability protein Rmi1 [Coniochaeta sp. 2T2.1]